MATTEERAMVLRRLAACDMSGFLSEQSINDAFIQPEFWADLGKVAPAGLLVSLGRELGELITGDETGTDVVRRLVIARSAPGRSPQRVPAVFEVQEIVGSILSLLSFKDKVCVWLKTCRKFHAGLMSPEGWDPLVVTTAESHCFGKMIEDFQSSVFQPITWALLNVKRFDITLLSSLQPGRYEFSEWFQKMDGLEHIKAVLCLPTGLSSLRVTFCLGALRRRLQDFGNVLFELNDLPHSIQISAHRDVPPKPISLEEARMENERRAASSPQEGLVPKSQMTEEDAILLNEIPAAWVSRDTKENVVIGDMRTSLDSYLEHEVKQILRSRFPGSFPN